MKVGVDVELPELTKLTIFTPNVLTCNIKKSTGVAANKTPAVEKSCKDPKGCPTATGVTEVTVCTRSVQRGGKVSEHIDHV